MEFEVFDEETGSKQRLKIEDVNDLNGSDLGKDDYLILSDINGKLKKVSLSNYVLLKRSNFDSQTLGKSRLEINENDEVFFHKVTAGGEDLSILLGEKIDKANIVNDLTTGGVGNVASAEVAKYLKDYIDNGFFPKNSYSKVISTQEEFDSLIASSTWLDATSVAFIGNFTANANIVIPYNVVRIDGYNGATISTAGYYSFGYSALPTGNGYSISGMNFVNFEINNCQYLTNCICTTNNNLDCYCFKGCSYIFNCTAKSTSLSGIAYCYAGCSNIVNCSASPIGVTGSAGYVNSHKIINSISVANSSNGDSNGFINSSNILNCNASSVSAKSVAYGFNGCYQVNNCKATATNKYSQSYKSTTANATYACANTDAGGWNQ